jgi:hypothetical protein
MPAPCRRRGRRRQALPPDRPGVPACRIAAHAGEISGLAIAEVNGRTLALSAGSDPALRLWDLSAGTLRAIR